MQELVKKKGPEVVPFNVQVDDDFRFVLEDVYHPGNDKEGDYASIVKVREGKEKTGEAGNAAMQEHAPVVLNLYFENTLYNVYAPAIPNITGTIQLNCV